MDLQNTTGGAIAISTSGVVIAAGATYTGLDDKWLQDEGVAALVTAGDLVASNYDASAGSRVVQPEVSAAVAASHTHTNAVELALVSDGDHDVATGNPHGAAPADVVYTAGTAGDWAGAAPTDLQTAIDRIAAQVAVNAAAPIA